MIPPTDHPRITVLIPCFNDGELIGETLTSLLEDRDLEIVIVDDASTDEATLQTLRGLEADGLTVVWRQENGGVARARADGLQASSAPYVYPLDADDVTIPGTISQMADRLDENPEAAVCFGDYEEFGLTEIVRAVPEQLDPFRVAYANEYPVSSLFRRSVLDDLGGWTAGGFDERSHEDWNLWMALVEGGYTASTSGRARSPTGAGWRRAPAGLGKAAPPDALRQAQGSPSEAVRRHRPAPARVRPAAYAKAPVPVHLRRAQAARLRAEAEGVAGPRRRSGPCGARAPSARRTPRWCRRPSGRP